MDPRQTLAGCPLFSGLAPDALDWLAQRVTPLSIHGGDTLFKAGERPDQLFIVASGRLRAQMSDGRVAGEIARLEPIGEIGLISDEPRQATVFALRDSLLLRIAREDWLQFLNDNPQAMLAITRVIIQRMRMNQRQTVLGGARASQTIAIVPAHDGNHAHELAHELTRALSTFAPARLLDSDAAHAAIGDAVDGHSDAQLVGWLNACEHEQRYLVYVGSHDDNPWTRRCLRQADRILVVADSAHAPTSSPSLDRIKQHPTHAPIELVLIRPRSAPAGDVIGWRARAQARAHYFLRPQHQGDMASLARQLTGRGVGLVLGGGGARGFAHIGLIGALEDLGIPVDLCGGTSMGAFVAALLAAGFDSKDMLRIARETFVDNNFLNDYLLPRVSLIRGRKFLARLRALFGERGIEELRTPYFCVTTNLTRARAAVHNEGPLYIWLGTSMSVPGFAPPMTYQGDLLADGAVMNALPTDVMQNLARGPIIASDVSSEGGPKLDGVTGPDPEALLRRGAGISLVDLLFRTATLTSESGSAARAERADLYLRMPVSGIALFDWKKLEETVERGYKFALARLTTVRSSLLNPTIR
jgi:predicted acylesterase/phospholipase RssA/CRP-like cAMP-binding protein